MKSIFFLFWVWFVICNDESTGKPGRNETEWDEQLLVYADVINLVRKH